jgi:hypothetical protein
LSYRVGDLDVAEAHRQREPREAGENKAGGQTNADGFHGALLCSSRLGLCALWRKAITDGEEWKNAVRFLTFEGAEAPRSLFVICYWCLSLED